MTAGRVREARYAVVGLGGIGSAASYWLARRAGTDVVGFEQYALGHDRGASEDHSRIIRRSYHTPWYVRLADAAYRTWDEVEREAGERLIVRTGGLDLWPAGAAIPMEDYTGSLAAEGVEFEELDAAEVMRRWPQWRLGDDVRGLFQPDGGIAAAYRCNAAHRRLAVEHGATLLERAPVSNVDARNGEIEFTVAGERWRCERLVVAVDAWTNALLAGLRVRLPLTVTQEQVTYFRTADPAIFAPERFPIWIWMDDPSFYGFPAFGETGPKAAQDVGGKEVESPERSDDPDEDVRRRVHAFVGEHLPDAGPEEIVTRTCLYTMPPDRDFIVDSLPRSPNVHVALGAAHGFKFTSLFGRILADLAVDGVTEHDISHFAVDRPILTMADPPTSFLV